MSAKIIAFREKGWMDEKTDYRQWDNLARSFGIELQLIYDISEAEIPEDHKVIVLDETGDYELHDFSHPEKVVYIFGRTLLNRLQDIIPHDYCVKITTQENKSMFGISVAGIVLYDRACKK